MTPSKARPPSSPELDIRIDPDGGPIGLQLREQLTWMIAIHALQPGDRLPSVRALAAQLGIHHHTVRAAYHRMQTDGLVEVEQGVGATVRPFTSLQLARPRVGPVASTIGVLVAGFDPIYLPFLRGVEEVAHRIRALTIVCVTEDSEVKARVQIDQLVAHGVSGIIAVSIGHALPEQLRRRGGKQAIPIVSCDMPDLAGHSLLTTTDGAGLELAAHLAGHGHDRVTLMTPSIELPNMAGLHAGFQQAVADGTLAALDVKLTDGFTLDAGRRAMAELWKSGERPRAIAATGDSIAIGALLAARSLGISVPGDLALVSYGQIDAAEVVDPPITTVEVPFGEMGREGTELLVRLMRGERVPARTRTLPARLVVRESCGSHA